jgi:hypothetical protein
MWERENYRVAATERLDVEEREGLFALEELHRGDFTCGGL